MARTVVRNTIIGPITHSETTSVAGSSVTGITITHTYQTADEIRETFFNFTFPNVAECDLPAYQVGMTVMVDFDLVPDNYDFQLKANSIKLLGQTIEDNPMSVATSRVTGTIANAWKDQYEGTPYIRFGIAHEVNRDTRWMNFSYWNVPPHQEFLYEKGNVVTVDYNVYNKDDRYGIRAYGRINLHQGQPKEEQAAA